MFGLLDDFDVALDWRPLGAWAGRSPPERAKVKLPLARQDVSRWCRRMNIPFNPPPRETEPTRAAGASLYAEECGALRAYVLEIMHMEWGEGQNINDDAVLREVASKVGLDAAAMVAAADDPVRAGILDDNWAKAQRIGVVGVPSFVVDDQIFWGNDRIDFVAEHLKELGLAKQ